MITKASIGDGSDFLVAQSVVDTLQTYFPGWEWTAKVDQGIVFFKNLTISQGWCMQLRQQNLSKALVLEKGGEFLDRFNMPTKYDESIVYNAKVDFTGAMVSEKWTPDRRYYNKTSKTWKAAK